MDFLIPARLLKPEQWNHVCIEWNSYSPDIFGLKINKPYDAEFTKLPTLDNKNKRKFSIKLDTREIIST